MAILRLRTFGDPVLREKCCPLKEIDERTRQLAQNLIETMYHYNGLGLAANQVGVVKSIFVYDMGEGPVVCINPRIVAESEEKVEEGEGCLSLPGVQVPVSRPLQVEIEYTDIEGGKRRAVGEGLLARLFKHEMDHLQGRLLLDETDRQSRVAALTILSQLEEGE
jgi:peptide deformylase